MKRGAPRHPKVKRLARLLKIPHPHAVGILEMLWHFTAEFAAEGDIGRVGDEDIADAVMWTKDPTVLVDALVETRWLDTSDEYRLVVHDWHDHADEATRKKLIRAGSGFATEGATRKRAKPTVSAENQTHVGQSPTKADEGGQSQPRAGLGKAGLGLAEFDSITEINTITRARESERWTDEQAAAFLKKLKWKPSDVEQAQVDQILSVEPRLLLDLSEKPGSLATIQQQLIQFEEFFWPQYWRKTDKKAAREVWLKVTAESFDAMADALEGESRQRAEMLAKDEQYRPHAATWLRHRRWTDEAASHAD